jgi:hypothetical protein
MAAKYLLFGNKKALFMLLALSLMLHLFVILNLGGYRLLIDEVFAGNRTIEMPPIMQMRQLSEEYTVNLETADNAHGMIREMPVNLAIQENLPGEGQTVLSGRAWEHSHTMNIN